MRRALGYVIGTIGIALLVTVILSPLALVWYWVLSGMAFKMFVALFVTWVFALFISVVLVGLAAQYTQRRPAIHNQK